MIADESNKTQMSPRDPSATLPWDGLVRVALAGAVLLLVGFVWPGAPGAYVAAGLAMVFGGLLVARRPLILSRERAVPVVLDALLIGVLVASTGGAGSVFFPLYFLAALGIARVEIRAKAAFAAAAVVGGYPVALLAAGDAGELGSPRVILGLGLLALFCAAAWFLGSEVRSYREGADELVSDLESERDRADRAEVIVSKLGPVFEVLNVEGTLQWTVEVANALVGGSFAHVAALNGNHHRTVAQGDLDVCPTWWHPSIQRLVLWCSREGAVVRSNETVRGIESFLAVPVGLSEGEGWGALVVGGRAFSAEDERVLMLLARGIAPALGGTGDASGGLDQLSGLPNRESLRRVLRRELSQGRTLTVMVMSLDGLRGYNRTYGDAAGDALMRRIGAGLRDGQQRAFRYGEDEFAVMLGGTGETRARKIALALQKLVSEATRNAGRPPMSSAVGFAFAEAGERDPDTILEAALRALGTAKGRADGIVGAQQADTESMEGIEGEARITGVVRGLVEALEAKDPYIGGHLKAVSRLALRMGLELSLSQEQQEALVTGALLHDVGKIGVPDHILHKPARLTEEEYALMKRHPVLGAEIVAQIEELAPTVPVIRHHHERFDGRGYPDGLRAGDIPLLARIVSVADALDSMVRERPYGYGISWEAALKEVEENSGTQFDPRVVEALLGAADSLGNRRLDSTG